MAELPIDAGGLKNLAGKTFDTIDGFLSDHSVPAFLRAITAGAVTALVMIVPVILAVLVQGVLGVGTWFAVTYLNSVGEIRQKSAADFNAVIAASLSELLGVDISGDDIPTGTGQAATIERVRVIGDKLHDLLTAEFGGLSPINPSTGAENARKFSGFAINFATATAFIAVLTEASSIGLLKNFRELGETTAQSLGLGRLQRLALQPLIRNMIQQPYDLYLKGQLRPDRLTESQYVKAFLSGKLTEDQTREALAQKGYPDDLIELLISDLAGKLTATQLTRLIRYDVLTLDQAVAEMTSDGWEQEKARKVLIAELASRADSQVSGILTDLELARLNGFLDQGEFSALVDELPLSDEEDRLYRKKVADQLERPRARVSFSQVKAAVVSGIEDFDYLDRWLETEGYSDEDQLVLEYEILQALDKQLAKDQIAAQKAARKAAAVPPVSPPSTPTQRPL